ncbi:MAG TPA: nitroreductase family deazaflavin-dependent oxidoreductase [Chloroflexia bacterium]|nr:nitroreductase family deazaflavin-dependent oxidoreductase [Chloroflexia bacterium]
MIEQNEEVLDSPTGWVAKHIRTYVESGGERGHKYSGLDSLLLTTRGRKSGKLRRTALFYGRDADRYVLVASNGGSAGNPLWYLNLLEEPLVELQVGKDIFSALARPATEEEKPALWQIMIAIMPQYEGFQSKTKRDIPVVVVERTDEPDTVS